MRSSRYNYIVNDGDSVIFFNGISESFFGSTRLGKTSIRKY